MEEEKRKAYSEVVEILKLIEDEHKIEQIPFEVIQLIKANADPLYKPEISKEKSLEEQGLRNETYSIMAWIASKYWNEDIGEIETNENVSEVKQETVSEIKEETTEKIEEHTTSKVQEQSGAAYNDIEPEVLEGTNLPALVPEVHWYEKIKMKIIQILRFIFKRKNVEEGVNE